jgi:formylglycine-generating enzyme required for sulfatase activity
MREQGSSWGAVGRLEEAGMYWGVARTHGKSSRCLHPAPAVLLVSLLIIQGCTGITLPHSAVPAGATATAVLSAGSTRLRARDGMTILYVPEGTFLMGSDYLQTGYARRLCREYLRKDTVAACQPSNYGDETPAHAVTLDGFWLDRTEVSNAQYKKCELAGACEAPAESGSHYRSSYYGTQEFADHPVIFVTLEQARVYCGWVGGRLPTEAEWEYAARGPESLIFPWGNEFDGTRLNYCDANCDAGPNDPTVDDGHADTAPVGSFPSGASWVGALDMAGNVREWTAGWYGSYPAAPQVNPDGSAVGDLIVPRGGSWIDNPSLVRSANRGGNTPDYYRDYYGFRCVGD